MHPEAVAGALGLARGTVYMWLAKYREGGKDALTARSVPGRPPKLSGSQLRRLYTLIVGRDPRQYEFEFALWTRELIRRQNVNHDRLARCGGTSKDDLKAKAIGALRRLQKRPHLVCGSFADPHLRYITATT